AISRRARGHRDLLSKNRGHRPALSNLRVQRELRRYTAHRSLGDTARDGGGIAYTRSQVAMRALLLLLAARRLSSGYLFRISLARHRFVGARRARLSSRGRRSRR